MNKQSSIPDGQTDNLTVRLPPDITLDDLVDYVFEYESHDTSRQELLYTLSTYFALSYDDARLVLDRVCGGKVRASSGLTINEPDPTKDPIAYISYHRCF